MKKYEDNTMKLFSFKKNKPLKKTILTCGDINIRDPFVVCENGKYYLYGTRANNFGKKTAGFDTKP